MSPFSSSAKHVANERPQFTCVFLTILFCALGNVPVQGQTGTNKWLQIPDTSPNGLDVRALDPNPLADDFRCTLTGPITQVRIWGSWRFDQVPTAAAFSLGIWSDLPSQSG